MTFTNTQTTELSLDQLDDISAGWIGGAFKAAAKVSKTVGRNVLFVATDLVEDAGIPVYTIADISKGPSGWIRIAKFTHRGGWQESAGKVRNTANKARNLFGRLFG